VERGEERKEERRRQQTISTGERRGDWRRREETRGETKAEAVTDNARATVNAPLGVGGARHPRHPRATNSCEVDKKGHSTRMASRSHLLRVELGRVVHFV